MSSSEKEREVAHHCSRKPREKEINLTNDQYRKIDTQLEGSIVLQQ